MRDLTTRIADALRAMRTRQHISREQLAAVTHVDAQMIKRIESGRGNPALVVVSQLASALLISLSLMVGVDAAELSADDYEPFTPEAIGDTIATLRRQRNLSRRALAANLELQTGTLRKYETGASDLRLQLIEPIAGALGVTVDQFIRDVEFRQRNARLASGRWHTKRPGVVCRLVSAGDRSQLWEWRFGAGVEYAEEPASVVVEEIASVIRGTMMIQAGDETHRLRRGASVQLPVDGPRRFVNERQSVARLLRFQVRK